MKAMYSVDEQPVPGHPLAKGASPAAIRVVLSPEDRAEFDAAYAQALDDAKISGDLVELFTTLDRWRRVAALTSDPEVFRRVALRAAMRQSADPGDDPVAATQALPER
ncbi:DUF6247 family protein [Actinomycetospora sp. CA-053990]|uniref:DUF6247 family protein n=1 Tax=Actinomycetospora sp. CA-053990 TaxID=3239891 RepID=UPI003D90EED7